MAAKQEKQLSFEEAIANLEGIIERIETGEIGLEESLLHYEKGMKLVTRCRGILDSAEKKIAELTREPDGSLAIERSADDASDDESIQAQLDDDEADADSDEEAPF